MFIYPRQARHTHTHREIWLTSVAIVLQLTDHVIPVKLVARRPPPPVARRPSPVTRALGSPLDPGVRQGQRHGRGLR